MKLFSDIGQQALQETETPERRDTKKVSPVIARVTRIFPNNSTEREKLNKAW